MLAAPASAQIKAEAEQCLIENSSEQVHTVLMNLNNSGYVAAPEIKGAFNRIMLACEQRHDWQRAQTVDAGAYAGFLLRFRAQEKDFLARGVSQSRLASLRTGAGYLAAGDNSAMSNWLRQNGYGSFSAFRSTNDFRYFEAWMGVLSSLRKLETGSL